MSFLRRWVLRPSFWTALIALVAYWDDIALLGSFVYDDAGSIKNNDVVTGKAPWQDVFYRDFWGTPLKELQSHKSFRPITTITFKWNYMYAGPSTPVHEYDKRDKWMPNPWGFHVVNIVLHAIVTGLVTETATWVFQYNNNHNNNNKNNKSVPYQNNILWIIPPLMAGLIFGLHPVHAEAVSNITSRGEMLMSMFSLTAFLCYVHGIRQSQQQSQSATKLQRIRQFFNIYVIPWFCMICSLFSKEQGATTLITLIAYDFIVHHYSVRHYIPQFIMAISKQQQRRTEYEQETLNFFKRTIIFAIQTIVLVLYRLWLNGETSPDFVYEQNPAGFSEDRFTRVFSVAYVYCLYVIDTLVPIWLAPDWSGVGIDLITSWEDKRVMAVIALWTVVAIMFVMVLFEAKPETTTTTKTTTTTTTSKSNHKNSIMYVYIRNMVLVSFFAFTLSPFLLSSNLLVVVGLMKADRVIYLPLIGFCIMEALVFQCIAMYDDTDDEDAKDENQQQQEQQQNKKEDHNNNGMTTLQDDITSTNEETIITTARKDDQEQDTNINSAAKQEHDDDVARIPTDKNETENETEKNEAEEMIKPLLEPTQLESTQYYNKLLFWLGSILFMIQMGLYAAKTHERNIAWSHPLGLWLKAYEINPRSHHTIYNCGYELSLAKRYEESEQVLRPIGGEDPGNIFVYSMVLFNMDRCERANKYINKGLKIIAKQEKTVGDTPRNTVQSNSRHKSNLLVVKAYCAGDLMVGGRIMYEAVQADPSNSYAIEQAQNYMKRVEEVKEKMAKYNEYQKLAQQYF